ncbi:unnamed protein product [Clonostachys rhizophaga]|uniref:Uncharacterized protein n=1 Tax=Clonostachys rhizophaga TaxID=160324 RepID=A0A9N9V0W1_9HYPO|nr:unnamed protein product [Clonostachys rhizophaga]
MAGVPLSHHLLKHSPASVCLRVVLLSPNDEMLWTYATVRADPEAHRAMISPNAADRPQRIIECNTIIIATGSSCKDDMPFKNLSDTETTK